MFHDQSFKRNNFIGKNGYHYDYKNFAQHWNEPKGKDRGGKDYKDLQHMHDFIDQVNTFKNQMVHSETASERAKMIEYRRLERNSVATINGGVNNSILSQHEMDD